MKGKMKSASLFLLALVLCSCATVKTVTYQEAVEIAGKQLVIAWPNLEVMRAIPDEFSVTYSSDRVLQTEWRIGFEATDRRVDKNCVYYVTVFPDGKTGEIRIDLTCNVTSRDIGRWCKITHDTGMVISTGPAPPSGMITREKRGQTWYDVYVGILSKITDTDLWIEAPYPDRPTSSKSAGVSRKNVVAFEFIDKQ